MADTVASQTLFDGSKRAIMKFTNISDGTGEAAVLKVDASTLVSYQGKTCASVSIERVVAMTDGMSVDVLWDATTPLLAFSIPQNQWIDVDFREFNNLVNNAGAGVTGDIKFTTVGHTAGDRYTIILYMTKNYNALGA